MEIFPLVLAILFSAVLGTKFFFVKFKKRINPVLIGKNQKSLYVKILETTPIFLTTILIFLTIINFSQGNISTHSILSYLGLVVGLSSLYFLISGYYCMGNSWRIGISNTTKTPLITSGIFSLTRNPVYIAFDLFTLGLFLTTGHLIFFLLFLTMIINLHLLILEEEKSLKNIHQEKYMKYKEKAPRYFKK